MGADLSADLAGRRRLWLYRPRPRRGPLAKILFFHFLVIFIIILILAISAGQIVF
jgi:hypothetical protein